MVSREQVMNATLIALVVCAVALTAGNLRHQFFPSAANLSPPLDSISDWRTFAADGEREGGQQARVTVVVFADYECAVCQKLAQRVAILRREFPEELAVVWRQFPLTGQRYSLEAANTAFCANEQRRFAEYNQVLFAGQKELGKRTWQEFASAAGVPDLAAFATCAAGGRFADAVQRDVDAGHRLRVVGTPTILINHRKYRGLPLDFDRLIYSAMRVDSAAVAIH